MKRTPKTLRIAAVMFSIGALVVGCSSSATPAPSQAPAATQAPATAAASQAQATAAMASAAASLAPYCPKGSKTSYTVAMVRWTASDIFFNGVQLGEQMEKDRILKDCGVTINWKLFGANDVSQQLTALQADLSVGVDAVDLVPWQGAAFTATLKQLASQKMPVVVHNANVPGAPQTFVAFDNVAAGLTAGNAVVKKLDALRGTAWRTGTGVFIELRCIIGASFDIGRDKGYHQAVDPIVNASNGKIKVETREVGCNDAKGRTATDDIISKNGQDQILGVLAIDGDSGFGAQAALDARGMSKPQTDKAYVPVVAVDGSEAEMASIAKGQMLTAAEQPAIAEGVIVERLLFQQMATGTLITAPTTDSTYDLPDYAGAPWQPVKITTSPDFTGAWYQTQTFDVTSLPSLDDHWHWANVIDHQNTGQWPHYDATGCASGCPKS